MLVYRKLQKFQCFPTNSIWDIPSSWKSILFLQNHMSCIACLKKHFQSQLIKFTQWFSGMFSDTQSLILSNDQKRWCRWCGTRVSHTFLVSLQSSIAWSVDLYPSLHNWHLGSFSICLSHKRELVLSRSWETIHKSNEPLVGPLKRHNSFRLKRLSTPRSGRRMF